MTTRPVGRYLFLLFLLCASLGLTAGPVWEDKPYTDWTLAEAQQILSDSPWVRTIGDPKAAEPAAEETPAAGEKQGPVLLDVPGYGANRKKNRQLSATVQWMSAFTMRQAMARRGLLQKTMTLDDAMQLVLVTPEQYVIAVRGHAVPLMMASFSAQDREGLRASAYLQPEGGEKIQPVGIEVFLQQDPPSVFFYFPRGAAAAPLLTPDTGAAEFNWSTGMDTVNATFDLTRMTRGGKPDL